LNKKTIIATTTIILICALGITFLGYLLEETLHVIHSKGKASSICLNFNTKINDSIQKGWIIMHTTNHIKDYESLQAYNNWREKTENTAKILIPITTTIIATITGYLIRKITKK
jgi:hypothetical protein